jgi:deoxyhypusine synthase
MSDEDLESSEIMRIGDVLANREEYQEADEWVGSVINQLDLARSYSVREFLGVLGRELSEIANEDGILTAAFKSRVPVFCPDLTGSEIAIGIARAKFEKKLQISIDATMDTMEMLQIAQKTRNSGVITLGSCTSQSMINITELSSYITRGTPRGHKYAINISTDSSPLEIRTPSYGGSHHNLFGKLIKNATTAYVPCDPSIALPMIITALSQTAAKFLKGRKRPTFSFAGREMNIDVP